MFYIFPRDYLRLSNEQEIAIHAEIRENEWIYCKENQEYLNRGQKKSWWRKLAKKHGVADLTYDVGPGGGGKKTAEKRLLAWWQTQKTVLSHKWKLLYQSGAGGLGLDDPEVKLTTRVRQQLTNITWYIPYFTRQRKEVKGLATSTAPVEMKVPSAPASPEQNQADATLEVVEEVLHRDDVEEGR